MTRTNGSTFRYRARFRHRARLALLSLIGLLLCGPATPQEGALGEDEFLDLLSESLVDALAQARKRVDAPAAQRSPRLDAVARQRAESIAATPPASRLPPRRPLFELMQADPSLQQRRIHELIDLQDDAEDPASACVDWWLEDEEAETVLTHPLLREVGAAVAEADDGTLVLVALFMNEHAAEVSIADLEQRVEAAINRIRRDQEVRQLRPLVDLRRVARAHSKDMATRRFFAHDNPDGMSPAMRVDAARIEFRMVAENLGLTFDVEDPVGVLVRQWMDSPGHRRNILDGRFVYTGIGIHRERGRLFVTQLFMRR